MKVYLVLISSVLSFCNKVNAGLAPPRESLVNIDSLRSGSLVDRSTIAFHQITSKPFHRPKVLNVIGDDEDALKGPIGQEVHHLSQSQTNSRLSFDTRLESLIEISANPTGLSDTGVLANNCAPINTFPTRQSDPMIEGWALPLVKNKTISLRDDPQKEYVYEPREISFRVNSNKLIGSGYWMNCYHAEMIINRQLSKMIAKRNKLDVNNRLEFYLKQAQLYFYASKVLYDFKQVIIASPDFGNEDKALIAPLRFVENFVVLSDNSHDKLNDLKINQDCWFFEEELVGEYLKYVGNEDFASSWVKNPSDDDFSTIENPTKLGIALQAFTHWHFDQNEGSAVLGDLQGSGSVLTDPAMVDINHEWHNGNTGVDGIKGFVKTHKCNRWCTQLGLPTDLSYPIHQNWK